MEYGMQGKKLFVGNLSHCVSVEEETAQLKALFSDFGLVEAVNIIKGKRYGFVEMSNTSEAEKAKSGLHDHSFNGCALTVNEVGPSLRKRDPRRRR
jgi:RNA recognition motif-containing protein